jgi:hypothetical protein
LAKRAEKLAEEPKNEAPAAAAKSQAPAEAARSQAPAAAAQDQAPATSVAGTLSQSREDALGERENRMRQERPGSAVAPSAAPPARRELQRDAIQAQGRANFADEPPEKWLERIVQLRQQGRHDEADKALAEFRMRYPDYRIPEATLEKVEKK